MNVNDIAAKTRYIDKTSRTTHPLDPYHTIHGMEIKDDNRFTKPKQPKSLIEDNHQLLTRDIAGAYVGWKSEMMPRKEFKNTNNTSDIKGAQASTFRIGITTTRETNPLLPVYQSLDPGDILPPVIAPLMPATLVTNPTIRAPKGGTSSHHSSNGKNSQSIFFGAEVHRASSTPATNSVSLPNSSASASSQLPGNFNFQNLEMPQSTSYAFKFDDKSFLQPQTGKFYIA